MLAFSLTCLQPRRAASIDLDSLVLFKSCYKEIPFHPLSAYHQYSSCNEFSELLGDWNVLWCSMNCPSSGTIKSSSQSHQLDVSCFNKTSKLTNLKMSPLMFRVALRCFDFSFQWTKNEQLLTLRHHKSNLSQAFWSHVIYMTACVLTQPEEDESFFFLYHQSRESWSESRTTSAQNTNTPTVRNMHFHIRTGRYFWSERSFFPK